MSLRHGVPWWVQDSGFLRPGGRTEGERGEACGDCSADGTGLSSLIPDVGLSALC